MSATGEFSVAWHEIPLGAPRALRLRRFDAAGVPLGDIVNVASYASQFALEMVMSPSGRLVVGFRRTDDHIYMRRYDAAGQALGGEARVSTGGVGLSDPRFDLAVNAAGDFAFVWTERVPLEFEQMLHTRLYRASGTAVTGNLAYSFRELGWQAEAGPMGFGPDNFAVFFRYLDDTFTTYGQMFAGVRDTRPSCSRFIATLAGTAGPDVLQGSADHDIVAAGAGNDTVTAGDGADVVCGADGDDTCMAVPAPIS